MNGIHFAPMTGTGPSNFRAEHIIKEMLSVKNRTLKRRLFRLLGEVVERGLKGDLPDPLRWILGSTATFLDKPGKPTPRPIRCGE